MYASSHQAHINKVCFHFAAVPILFTSARVHVQMEQEGIPSTTLRECSVLKSLNDSKHVVRCDHLRGFVITISFDISVLPE